MASNNLTKALSLLDSAEKALQEIRLKTPIDYMDAPESVAKVTGRMMEIDDKYLNAAMTVKDGLDAAEMEVFRERFGFVNRMFEYLAGERTAGRPPQLKDAPWPPYEWIAKANMRADAAEAASEPALNGHDEASNA